MRGGRGDGGNGSGAGCTTKAPTNGGHSLTSPALHHCPIFFFIQFLVERSLVKWTCFCVHYYLDPDIVAPSGTAALGAIGSTA